MVASIKIFFKTPKEIIALNRIAKNLLSLEENIEKPSLYVKEILPQNVVFNTDDCSIVVMLLTDNLDLLTT